MKSFIYRRWDGSQALFSLKRRDVVDRFMEGIMQGMSPEMSLLRMLWEGVPMPMAGVDFRVMSLKEMVEELERQMQEIFSRYNLEKAFDDPARDVASLIEAEARYREQRDLEPPPAPEELPPGLLDRIEQLSGFDFQDSDSRELLDHWQGRRKDIVDLYDFYSRHHEEFTGDQALGFDEAVDLMRRYEEIQKLERQILSGRLRSVDLEALKKLLGENAERSFNVMLQIPGMLRDEGVARFGNRGVEMTPRGMRVLGEKAFGRLYSEVQKDRQGGHLGNAPQSGEIEPDSSRPYRFGDRLDLDLTKTILEAVATSGRTGRGVALSPEGFYVRDREPLVTSTIVVLLDLSWSMSFGGRFEAAKKVALALDHYVRTRFPKDRVHVIGFSTAARELQGDSLALSCWDQANPYTNLQAALRLAMQLIRRSGNRNNRVLVITDGQPTAYYDDENRLHVEMPLDWFGLSQNAAKATLNEVRKVTAGGMRIEIFMLDDSPALVEFSRQICRINKGRAVLCLPQELGRLVVIEEVRRRGGRV